MRVEPHPSTSRVARAARRVAGAEATGRPRAARDAALQPPRTYRPTAPPSHDWEEKRAMTTQAKATFQITGWNEEPIVEESGKPKLTKAHVTCTFSGDIEGDGVADYLMVYPAEDSATFVGLQQ